MTGEVVNVNSSATGVSGATNINLSTDISPLDVMVGGMHYKGGIQPVEFYHANPQLDFQQCNMIKYAYRHFDKKGTEDLLKVIHYALLEVQFHYGDKLEEFKEKVKELI